MSSLSGPELQRAFKTVGLLSVLRGKGVYSEDEIAGKLGFGSVEGMYVQLENWGVPDWLKHGEVSTGSAREAPTGKRKRKARRGTGEAVELPPASAAAELLREAVEEMGRAVSSLVTRNERYRDERFETFYVHPSASRTFIRDQHPKEYWLKICEERGEDPDQEAFTSFNEGLTISEGAARTPPKPLTELVAVYVLSGKPLRPLLEVLHHEPQTVDEERLEKAEEQLRHMAGQLAILVRGGSLRRGPSTGELGPQEQLVPSYVAKRRREGASDEEIHSELRQHGYTKDDVKRLGNFSLELPEQS